MKSVTVTSLTLQMEVYEEKKVKRKEDSDEEDSEEEDGRVLYD